MNEKKPGLAALQPEEFESLDILRVFLYTGLLFLTMTAQTSRMSVLLPFLALALSIGRGPLRRLRERFGLPLAGFFCFALMNGFAAVYASVGSYALAEFNKFIASFAVAVILVTRFDKKHVRALLWGVAAVCAVLGLLCVDLGSWRGLFEGFNGLMQAFGTDFTDVLENSQGGRINGLYNDANITGAILGPAVLLTMHLVHTSEKLWHKGVACLFLGLSSVGFLTAVSRGAIGFFVLAALVYLAAERENRTGLFFLMFATAVSMLSCGGLALANMTTLGSLVPVLLCFVCGGMVFLLDWGLTRRLTRFLKGKGKLVIAGAVAFVAAAFLAVLLALNWTEPFVFSGSGMLYRSASLPVGEYTLTSDCDEGVSVSILGQIQEGILMKQTETLYSGPASTAKFAVSKDFVRVFFHFRGVDGAVIRSAGLSNGHFLKMSYRLLPELIAARLYDGILESHSLQQRLQYDKDGWKLFLRSPLIGFGLGSSESWLTSLQPFYYESLFLHNHILQVMCDMGLVGLVFWLAFLGGVLWLLIRRLRQEKDPLAAMLLSCWVMMVTHGLMEIDFSIRAFQCIAWILLLLPVMLYTKPIGREMLARMGCAYGALFLWGYLLVFGGLLESRRIAIRQEGGFSTNSVEAFLDATRRWIKMDVFDHEQHQLNFVGNAVHLDDARFGADMLRYVEELRSSGTYTACSGLARYYYLPLREYEELFACSREGVMQEASVSDAWNQQFDSYRLEVLPTIGPEDVDTFVNGVLNLQADLEAFSEGRIEEIKITAENQTFISQVESIREKDMDGPVALLYLSVFGISSVQG